MFLLYFGKVHVVYFCVLSFFLSRCLAKDYCSARQRHCGNNQIHVLCKYKSELPSTRCIYHENIVSEHSKKLILHKINDRRNKIAAGEIKSLPSAENMRKVVWNEEFALFAQRLADQCDTTIKDVCNHIGDVEVGQTVATVLGEAPGLTPAALVDVWYTELLEINSSVITSYQPSEDLHVSHYDFFTQLIWANSGEVGCGGVKYKQNHDQHSTSVYRLICNFAPTGNKKGEQVYKPGAPCTACPDNASCDTEFTALCRPVFQNYSVMNPITKEEYDGHGVGNEVINNSTDTHIKEEENGTLITNTQEFSTTNDDDFLPFDFRSHILNNTKQTITPSTELSKSTPCKGDLAIDDLVEMLKKRLSNDPLFKEMLANVKASDNNDSFTDANVSDFVGRLYSKKEEPTTTVLPESDYVNSTLLADLVEAVIFRNADKYKITTVESVERVHSFTDDVYPIKIRPELAQVKTNNEFTGHYFFPEEDTEELSKGEVTESYYDNSESTNFPVSDIMQELENIKKNTETKDFLDEILESELDAESIDDIVSTSGGLELPKSGHKNMNKFLSEIEEPGEKGQNLTILGSNSGDGDGLKKKRDRMRRDKKYHGQLRKPLQKRKKLSNILRYEDTKRLPDTRKECLKHHNSSVLHYGDLLGKLASDIEMLKFKENFHCSLGCTKNTNCIIIILCTFTISIIKHMYIK